MALDLDNLLKTPLPPGTKGLPNALAGLSTLDIAAQGWNLLRGDLAMPAAVIKTSALANNVAVMNAYLAAAGMKLAPHGKTTLCPQLFERQLDGGAWGITVATISQLALCHEVGVQRVLMANELVGEAEIAQFAALCTERPERDYYILVDSVTGAEQIQAGFIANSAAPPAKVLIEIGMNGGRCGVRNAAQAIELAHAVSRCNRIRLCGIEGYEGLIAGPDPASDVTAVNAYLDTVIAAFETIRDAGLFAEPDAVLLSAGGSVYYDLVSRLFSHEAGRGIVPIVRSGCYLTHDSGFYRRLLAQVDSRAVLGPAPRLLPALEVWARVLSRPEPGLAILSAGKRDVSFDIDLPVPQVRFRPADARPTPVADWWIEKLSDQHAFLRFPETADIEVGDLVGLGISHPCTTFDKWSLLFEVDDDYTVIAGLKTFF